MAELLLDLILVQVDHRDPSTPELGHEVGPAHSGHLARFAEGEPLELEELDGEPELKIPLELFGGLARSGQQGFAVWYLQRPHHNPL